MLDDVCHQLAGISNALSTTEGRLLRLVEEMAQGLVSVEDFANALSRMQVDLKGWYQQVVEKGKLRTIRFRTVKMLRELDEATVYLYRKIRQEEIFFRKLALEKELRSLVSTEAFALYVELEDMEECEKELSARSDAEVRQLLLGEDAASLRPNSVTKGGQTKL